VSCEVSGEVPQWVACICQLPVSGLVALYLTQNGIIGTSFVCDVRCVFVKGTIGVRELVARYGYWDCVVRASNRIRRSLSCRSKVNKYTK
jgi:hypothetical protein